MGIEKSCGIARVEQDIAIAAPRARVWRALTEEPGRWWPKDFYTNPLARGFVIEARVGGRLFEDWGEGGGTLWGTVIVCDPGRVLEWAGDLSPAYGGPARTIVRMEVVEKGPAACVLSLRDATFGRVDDGVVRSLESGWTVLLGELKKWAERP